MEHEIELKIMLAPQNIPTICDWLNQQNILHHATDTLINTYYDNADLFFAKHKMGLRVRGKNDKFEITLKTKGEIVGGLHIRPEYNLPLPNNQPDLMALIRKFNVDIEKAEQLAQSLIPTFSTDFVRETWLIHYQQSEIEIALDRGLIKNTAGEEAICEVEFELKQGSLSDLIRLLEVMPKAHGMWLSSLSKAQRGYLVGKPEAIEHEINKLCEIDITELTPLDRYQIAQQLADFIRLQPNESLMTKYRRLESEAPTDLTHYLTSADYLTQNIQQLKQFYLH